MATLSANRALENRRIVNIKGDEKWIWEKDVLKGVFTSGFK